MKKIITLAAGFVLSGLMMTTVHAGPTNGAGTGQTEGLQSGQSATIGQAAPPRGLSRRNKAVIEQSKAARVRRSNIQSSSTNTMPKGLSKRNKAMLKQKEAAKKRREEMQASPSSPVTK